MASEPTPASQAQPSSAPQEKPAPPPKLRPYQAQVVNDVYAKIRNGRRKVVIIAGTGAGKTVISGQICAHAEASGSKLLFLVHLDVLVGQTYEKMKSFGLQCGFIKAGWPENRDAPIQIASVQTMAKRDWWKDWPADLVFYDEGHTTVFSQVGQELLYNTHPGAVHLAMTATPYRLGNDQLGDHFETLVCAPPPTAIQKMGFLAKMKYFGIPTEDQVDLDGVQLVAGEYNEKQLKNACDRPELIQRVVQEWLRLTPDKRTIAFCVDVGHARHVAEAFNQAGVKADYVAGSTSIKKRKELYEAIGSGDLRVLTSCNVLSIGFDVPSIEVGLLLRPTTSSALHQQQIGRVMRISPQTGKKFGMILDQAGNLQRLGFPEDITTYELPYGSVETEAQPGKSHSYPKKQCPECNACIQTFVMECPECGHDWMADRPIYTQDLIALMGREQLSQITDEAERCRIYEALRQRCFRQGYDPNLARNNYYEYFEVWPHDSWSKGAIFGKRPSRVQMENYRIFLDRIARKRGRTIHWVMEEFEKEFGAGSWAIIAGVRSA